MRKLLCLLVPVCIALALLPGCASLTLTQDLGVQLVDLQIRGSTLLETTGEVRLRVTNRGAKDVSIKGAAVQVYVNGEAIGEGVTNEAIVLEGLTSQEIPLQLSLSHLSLASRLQPALETGIFVYRVDGKLFLPGWSPPIEINTTGQLDLRHHSHAPTPR